jgi:hypothetical protein
MSRILRRPMFRGGPVSSYGTGIASGLADGGMPPRRGLVIEPGGYAGKPKFKTGKEIMEEVWTKPWLTTTPLDQTIPTVDEAAVAETGEINGVDTVEKDSKWEIKDFEGEIGVNTWDEYITIEAPETGPGSSRLKDKIIKNPNYEPPYKLVDPPEEGPGTRIKTKKKVYLSPKEIKETKWSPGVDGEEHIPELSIFKDEDDNDTVEPELSAKEMVEANKKLFGELLGLDKARGEDISDMLMGASAKFLKPGATVRSGLGEFMEAEAVRPSRRQKLQDTASGLAIQDYIAGKRSKEQIEALKGKIDYEYDKKFEMSMPQKDDTLQMAKTKLLALKEDPGSTKGIKHLIGIQDPDNVDNIFPAKKGLKLKDITNKKSKALKNLHVGYNILVDADTGTKKIIKYDGSGTFGGVTIVTLTELWTKA